MSSGDREHDSDFGMEAARRAMDWYGWGSPVGLGLFLLLVAGAAAVLILAIHH